MATKKDLMALMTQHCGKGKGIRSTDISAALNITPRKVRDLVTECREDGIAICGLPSTGYYVAQTRDELEETIEFLKGRALHSLTLASTLSKMPLEDLVGQMHLRT